MNAVTVVTGTIAIFLILGLAGSTTYLFLNRGGSCVESDDSELIRVQGLLDKANQKIEQLEVQLENVKYGGVLNKKTGFFGVRVWILIVCGAVLAAMLFLAYFGSSSSRAIRRGAGAFGNALSRVTPSAIDERWNAWSHRQPSGAPVRPLVDVPVEDEG